MRSRTRPTTGVFLDRDDTIIRDRVYLSDPDGVEILPGAAEAIQALNRAGIPVIMVTNQSGIARGIFDMDALNSIHDRLTALMAQRGARIDAIYFCPHHPEGTREEYRVSCSCRKPEPGHAEGGRRSIRAGSGSVLYGRGQARRHRRPSTGWAERGYSSIREQTSPWR